MCHLGLRETAHVTQEGTVAGKASGKAWGGGVRLQGRQRGGGREGGREAAGWRRLTRGGRDTPQRDTPGLQHGFVCGKLYKFNIPGPSVRITARQCIGVQAFSRNPIQSENLGRG